MSRKSLLSSTEKALESKTIREIYLLRKDQVDFLEEFCLEVSKSTGFKLKKTHIVRSLVDYLKDKGLDPKRIESEADVKNSL